MILINRLCTSFCEYGRWSDWDFTDADNWSMRFGFKIEIEIAGLHRKKTYESEQGLDWRLSMELCRLHPPLMKPLLPFISRDLLFSDWTD